MSDKNLNIAKLNLIYKLQILHKRKNMSNEIIEVESYLENEDFNNLSSELVKYEKNLNLNPKLKGIQINLSEKERRSGFDKSILDKNALIIPLSIFIKFKVDSNYTDYYIPTWQDFFIYDDDKKIDVNKILDKKQLDRVMIYSKKIDDILKADSSSNNESRKLYDFYYYNFKYRSTDFTLELPFELNSALNGLSVNFEPDFDYKYNPYGKIESFNIVFFDLLNQVQNNKNVKNAYLKGLDYRVEGKNKKE